jgi:hypothetical protein
MDDTEKTVSVEAIMESAQHAFWAEVVKHLPLASSGDFDPMSSLVFEEDMERAIVAWWSWNASIHYNLKKTNGEILERKGTNNA